MYLKSYMEHLRPLSVIEENLKGRVTIFKFWQFFPFYRSTDYHVPHPPPPLHQKKNAWSQVRLTQIRHIVYFNKRSKVSAAKESETGQNYFTDSQEFMI